LAKLLLAPVLAKPSGPVLVPVLARPLALVSANQPSVQVWVQV
jgi:hypothetical protein